MPRLYSIKHNILHCLRLLYTIKPKHHYIMQKLLTIILLTFTFALANGQTVVSGVVRTPNKTPISDLSIVVQPKDNLDGIIAYGFSDSNGNYKIEFTTTADSVAISTMSLNYKDTTIFFANKNQIINFNLPDEVTNIDEIVVKSTAIRSKGDTVSYLVSSFTSAKDVSIGDVIKKMPGFDVTTEGRVYYQGQEIEKYYIEGLDLLEKNYSIANRNLPHKSVGAVEVLENHQPIKALQDKKFATGTSLNIKLKNNITITGTANLGVGFSPLLRDIRVSPMAFLKKQQLITTFQSNNIGDDLQSQFQAIRFSNGKLSDLSDLKQDYVGISGLSHPQIDKKRYLNNNANLVSYNQLIKLANETQLKINANYINDLVTDEGSNKLTYFMQDTTYSFNEITTNRYQKNSLNLSLGLEQNTKKGYLKNKADIRKYWDWEKGSILSTPNRNQTAETPHFSVSNKLDLLLPVGNNFFSIYSFIDYNNSPQSLQFTPGVFAESLNNGSNYNQATQNYLQKGLQTEHSVGFTKGIKRFSFDSEIGTKYNNENIETSIDVNGSRLSADSLNNNLEWNFLEVYFDETIRYETQSLKAKLSIPVTSTNYSITDLYHNSPKNISRTYINPSFNIYYEFNGYWHSLVSASYRKGLGSPEGLTGGYIISDHRNMSRKTNAIDDKESLSYYTNIKYRNSISGFFATISYNGSISTKNIMYKNRMVAPGMLQYEAILSDNKTISNNISTDLSLFIANWQTTFGIKANYSNNQREYLFNDNRSWINMSLYSISPSMVINKWRFLDIQYGCSFSYMQQKMQNITTNIFEQKHNWSLFFKPVKKHWFGVDFDYFGTNQKGTENFNALFTNLSYFYKPGKGKMSFKFKCNNLFNESRIIKYYNTDISLVETSYNLRPRQFIVSIYFEFSDFLRKKL